MTSDTNDRELKNRLTELSARAAKRRDWVSSEFLTTAEQEVLSRLTLPSLWTLWGGYDGAERRLALFGSEEDAGYAGCAPCRWLRIAPKNDKFADELSHRDFLGALMGLGIRRETLGDIIVSDKTGYLCCLDSVAEYILREFHEVKRTAVTVTELDAAPDAASAPPEEREITVASPRLDALIAAVYDLSRAQAQELCAQGRVFVDSRPQESGDRTVSEGSVVSVRGHGRFICGSFQGETRRSRLRYLVRVY
jgi:RNA-binding protein YlmH